LCGCLHCRDVDLINVFEVFLPQLLLYPNPTDPLNGEAAALLMREPQAYEQRVRGAWVVLELLVTLQWMDGQVVHVSHFLRVLVCE
jgi:hypothetical protein